MLLDPSPRKVMVRPRSASFLFWAPLASAMVCRSARIWHGWKLSVSALMTGTSLAAARAASRSWPNVRQAIAATWRLSTRAVSPTVSPRPSCVLWDSMTSGLPPRSATPVAKETRVRSDGLSNITATVCGPASGLRANRSAFISGGQVQHLGLFGRVQVVITQEVPRRADRWAAAWAASGACSALMRHSGRWRRH